MSFASLSFQSCHKELQTVPRNLVSESFTNNERVSFDPTDTRAFERLHTREVLQGEGALMLAILENAVEYFQKYLFAQNDIGRKLFQEAEEWFLEKNADHFFSFESICETLELHPDYIREGLMSWKEKTRKEYSFQASRPSQKKLAKTRVSATSLRFPKTA
jgi:hypothetical protein